ncbi:MAG: SCP2 sterol-binding domain-containing protein [Actinomycetota bacterium]|nr:SCP2 sterol-binding domain-containing protein [Actinomycetota bacterium]
MPRFLSAEWVGAFDLAVRDQVLADPADDTGLVGSSGTFTVRQVVTGAPGGDVVVVLRAERGRLRLALGTPESGDGADVTISLAYEDAAALSDGSLPVAEALSGGRIRVRGDLSVLVDAQRMLARGRELVADLAGQTTY